MGNIHSIADLQTVAAISFAVVVGFLLSRKKLVSPPGPPGLPILGNTFDFPKKESWKVYLEWGKQYNSEILSLKVPGRQFIILNSARVVQDLLVKRSNIYSNRPHSTMLNDLIQTSWLIVFMKNNDIWKLHRYLFRREFDSGNATKVNRHHALNASRRLLNRLLTSPDYEGELRLAAVDSVLSITYGITPSNFEHPFIQVTEAVNKIFADVARGSYLVDIFPFLKHLPKKLPGLQFHSIADKAKGLAQSVINGPYDEIQAQVDNGTAVSSVASRFFSAVQEGQKVTKEEEQAMRNVLANAYLAGSDTSICVLYNFVLAMALHPEVQQRAQKQLDEVLGGQRLPDFSDFERLPYLAAVVNEIFRWHPVTPFAVYHVSTEDDVYEGYDIPEGSVIVPNAWALLQDETIFGPDTDKFVPERFMRSTEGGKTPEFADVDMAFGFGRRACPGRFIARDTVWIMAASMLSAYTIENPTDAEGRKLTADSPLEFTNAMISFAPHFNVNFKPRVPESLIHHSVESTE